MKTFGKVAGGIGLLLILSSPFTFLVSGSLAGVGIKAGLGAAMLGLWALTNGDRIAQWTRSVFFFGSSAVLALSVLGIAIAANFVVAKNGKTWDLTDKKIYSLSQQTRDTLKELTEPVKATVFVAGPVPESIDLLFQRYAQETSKLTWEIRDPRKSPDLAKKYNLKDVAAVAILARGTGDQESHTTASLGALASAQAGEQELTNALIRLNKVGEQRVYFTTGHGELSLELPENVDPNSDEALSSLRAMKGSLIADGYSPES